VEQRLMEEVQEEDIKKNNTLIFIIE